MIALVMATCKQCMYVSYCQGLAHNNMGLGSHPTKTLRESPLIQIAQYNNDRKLVQTAENLETEKTTMTQSYK